MHVPTPDGSRDGTDGTAAGPDGIPGGARQVPPADGLVAPVPAAVRRHPRAENGPCSAPARWAAEFAGTALIVFAGLGTGMFATEAVDSAVGFGLGLVAALVAFGHVSGGHFNPAVTLAAVVAGRTAGRPARAPQTGPRSPTGPERPSRRASSRSAARHTGRRFPSRSGAVARLVPDPAPTGRNRRTS